MESRRFARAAFVAALAALLFPGVSLAQSTAIAGIVTDATGGVLPGVTVEAASPALIEQTRTAVSDGSGRYRIEDLRPGTYKVTFTLPGFSTFVREGVVLESEFVASINAQLRVGTLEETVTVSGAPPAVDLQSTQSRTVLNKEQVDALPTGRTWSSICDGPDPNSYTSNFQLGVLTGGLRYCDHRQFDIPWRTHFKLSGAYPLPYGLRVSAVFQSTAGDPLVFNYIVTASAFKNLTGVALGQSSVTVYPLNEPGSA